ncbi:hypothetical protein NOVA_29075 [Nocardia nova]|uniref:hypothetical protein n=1 Tax=Nocardia nova TaxID=37330 RepID=UPI001C45187E|nr:hypothetical protein [Nocardia nova]MBV7706845.1 hypothetical protein [Nocardia nova]
MAIDPTIVKQVSGYHDLDELYALLGSEIVGDGWGAGAEDDEEHRRFGIRWFEDHLDDIRGRVCGSIIATELKGDLATDITTIASAELPFASDNQKLAVLIAAIILRRGLTAFCAES